MTLTCSEPKIPQEENKSKIDNNLISREIARVNIFIGNLPFGITGDELKRLLSVFGEVKSVIIMHDGSANTQETGLSGYIEMNQKSEGMAAIKCLNGITLKGRTICVIEALPLSPRKIEPSTRGWNAGLSRVRK